MATTVTGRYFSSLISVVGSMYDIVKKKKEIVVFTLLFIYLFFLFLYPPICHICLSLNLFQHLVCGQLFDRLVGSCQDDCFVYPPHIFAKFQEARTTFFFLFPSTYPINAHITKQSNLRLLHIICDANILSVTVTYPVCFFSFFMLLLLINLSTQLRSCPLYMNSNVIRLWKFSFFLK